VSNTVPLSILNTGTVNIMLLVKREQIPKSATKDAILKIEIHKYKSQKCKHTATDTNNVLLCFFLNRNNTKSHFFLFANLVQNGNEHAEIRHVH